MMVPFISGDWRLQPVGIKDAVESFPDIPPDAGAIRGSGASLGNMAHGFSAIVLVRPEFILHEKND